MKFYLVYKNHGLYDPVLDDQEPIFEPLELGDFDQPSQTTEVQYQHDFPETPNFLESRSLTASPFVLSSKPYRPFSTEPLSEVPPLEDPIILNPNYYDDFTQYGIDENVLPKTRFKLPISKQYDPDGTKQHFQFDRNDSIFMEQQMIQDEIKLIEQMKTEIDLENIERTASTVVGESLQKAISITEDIKNEIDFELRDYSNKSTEIVSDFENLNVENSKIQQDLITSLSQTESYKQEISKLVKLIDKTAIEISSETENDSQYAIKTYQTYNDDNVHLANKLQSNDQEVKDISKSSQSRTKNRNIDGLIKTSETKSSTEAYTKEINSSNIPKPTDKIKSEQNINSSSKTEASKFTTSNLKSQSEQRAFSIGLQTIPNIRGSIHSSYHYDLLLRTFFIHLTDVMVALSRFIVSEPALSKTIQKNHINSFVESNGNYESVAVKTFKNIESEKEDMQTLNKEYIQLKQAVVESNNKEDLQIDVEEQTSRKKSGSKMAQLSEKKSDELTIKMDAVISEFQKQTSTETQETNECLNIKRDRRSRSRSRIEEEVSKESDPLVWLSKMDDSENSFAQTVGTNEVTYSHKSQNINATRERQSYESSNKLKIDQASSESKNMYIAIVEAHVYTNENAILVENQTEMSEIDTSLERTKEIKLITTNENVSEFKECKSETEEQNDSLVISRTNENIEVINDFKETSGEVIETNSSQNNLMSVNKITNNIEILDSKAMSDFNSIDNKLDVIEKIEDNIINDLEIDSYSMVDALKATIHEREIEFTQSNENVLQIEKLEYNETDSTCNSDSRTILTEISKKHCSETKDNVSDKDIVSISTVEVINENFNKELMECKIDTMEIAKCEDKNLENIEITIDSSEKYIGETNNVTETCVTNEASDITDKEFMTTEIRISDHLNHISNDESVSLKITKEEISETRDLNELETNYETTTSHESNSASFENSFQHTVIQNQSTQFESTSTESYSSQTVMQEALFTAESLESSHLQSRNLTLRTDLVQENILNRQESDENNNLKPPSTVPPTPLTDEYIFRLEIPLPKTKGTTPIPVDPSPEHEVQEEDPHIVKKKLIPHIETTIESIIYDPPLPTPPIESNLDSPVFSKPGLKGGADRDDISKEELREIERKSSLLTSAIDETIKSIEEYKESVGMECSKQVKTNELTEKIAVTTREEETRKETKKENKIYYNGYASVEKQNMFSAQIIDKERKEEKYKINTDIQSTTEKKGKLIEDCSVNTQIDASINKEMEGRKELSESNTSVSIEQINDRKFINASEVSGIMNSNLSQEILESKALKKNITENISQNIPGFRSVHVDVKEVPELNEQKGPPIVSLNETENHKTPIMYQTDDGEIIGTTQGIIDGLEDAFVNEEAMEELGKPGMTEDKIAELISGESEMLREAHVMGLQRVISSHMNRSNDDDSSVDFKKIKPIIESLNDSEVLKALNDELTKTKEEKKKEERRWTTFLQKPKRPVPRPNFGYYKNSPEENFEEAYKVKIVKQPKPKVAPDYKPEDFETGPLPWEERALNQTPPPPIEPEEPIFVPEETPVFLEAIDPLPESEVPDLEDTGIPLPTEPKPQPTETNLNPEDFEKDAELEEKESEEQELDIEAVVEETVQIVEDMEQNRLAQQLMTNVQSMVDPNASLDQQLAQMRAQLAALAQLPGVIQQSLEMVAKQINQINQQESITMTSSQMSNENYHQTEEKHSEFVHEETEQYVQEVIAEKKEEEIMKDDVRIEEMIEDKMVEHLKSSLTSDELARMQKEEEEMLEERKREKQKKELVEQIQLEYQSRQLKQRPTPRVGKPKPVFGPLTPQERPVVLPGGRKWRNPKDAYNDQFIAETLAAQAELIQGKAKGVNFMKYEKPPVSLDHLQNSDVYKLIHNMEKSPMKRVELLTPVLAEADYREICRRSVTPTRDRMAKEEHLDIPQQVQP